MPKLKYEECKFKESTLATIHKANAVIDEYRDQGFDLTLRQLYYQFVSRGWIPNTVQEYKRLGDIVSKARRGGLIDWEAIVDRTRELRGGGGGWESPEAVIHSAARWYSKDIWAGQPCHVEVFFEKDALMGVFERVCGELRLPYFSCRGYTSDSELWSAARRLSKYRRKKQIVLLHFGDHDPSGVDMTRDIEERIQLFGGPSRIEVRRLALTMDQVEEYSPPPNPAKESDSRFAKYAATYGDESWELDALEPSVLAELVRREVDDLIDRDAWDAVLEEETRGCSEIERVAINYKRILAKIDR